MFCPNCGSDNRNEQNYCRSCGLKLEAIAKSIAEQVPSVENAAVQKRKDMFAKMCFGSSAITVAIGVGTMLSIIGYYKLLLFGPEVLLLSLAGAFGLFALISVFLFVYPKLFIKFEKADNRRPVDNSDDLIATGKLIDSRPFEPIGSVTEHTTELLRRQ